MFGGVFQYGITLRETNTFASENRVSQKETDTDIPTINFQVHAVSFRVLYIHHLFVAALICYPRHSLRNQKKNNLTFITQKSSDQLQYLTNRWLTPYILVYFWTLYSSTTSTFWYRQAIGFDLKVLTLLTLLQFFSSSPQIDLLEGFSRRQFYNNYGFQVQK